MQPISFYFDKIFWGSLFIGLHAYFFYAGWTDEMNRTDNKKNQAVLGHFLMMARAAARCLNLDMALVLFPVSRAFFSAIKSIPFLGKYVAFDKHIKLHMIIAYCIALFAIVHTVAHYFNFMLLERADKTQFNAIRLAWTTWAGATGQAMDFCLILMITTAMMPVKKLSFELFWYTHHLFILFFAGVLTHSMGCLLKTDAGVCYVKMAWRWVVAGLGVYALEILLRWFRAFRETSIRKIVMHPNKTFEIQFNKPSMVVKAGEYVHINIPEISWCQWHPITLTSCQEEGFHSVHIRVVGDWTTELAKRLGCMDDKGNWVANPAITYDKLPRLRIDGPFGTPSENVVDFEVALMVGGGIGITPFASLLKHIWFTLRKPDSTMKLKKVYFVWVARDTTSFEWFQDLLHHLESAAPPGFLDIKVFLTKPPGLDFDYNVAVNSTENGPDSVTKLHSKTRYGRPRVNELFEEIVRDYTNGNSKRVDVGVTFCGPPKLGSQLRIESHRNSNGNFRFVYRKEIF